MIVVGVGAECFVDCCCEFGPLQLASVLFQSNKPSEGLPLKVKDCELCLIFLLGILC